MHTEEALFLLLVGALWGCTNPLMRKASKNPRSDVSESNVSNPIIKSISKLANIKIWLPYAVNQLGSLLYYKLLASSRLTVSVPICNATAMAFSCITSLWLGERVDKPRRASVGVVLIMVGSGICMMANENSDVAVVGNTEKDEL
jgi:drug/metabolite transporter (DMT)-like permease